MVSLFKTALKRTMRAANATRRTARHQRGHAESLETRSLLSATTWPGLSHPVVDAEENNTLDAAQDLGEVSSGQPAELVGAIGDTTSTSSDVDWFRFTLAAAGRVKLTALPDSSSANSPVVLTLYGDQLTEFDPTVPLQHQLLGRQETNTNGPARPVDLRLEAGTYFVAISGAGNRFFHPFTADSGVPGVATEYGVRIAVTNGVAPTNNHDQFAPVPEPGRRGNDTADSANELGDLTAIGHLQITGTIGDDRFYDVESTVPFAMNPAADVDLYHFSITGDGTFGLIAESYAGRIGSPLDPALTLFQADDTGTLHFVATNNNSLNSMESTNGQFPFASDAVLFSGLTAGEYFLAVSSSGNDAEFGPDGVFDPNVAHSGLNGGSVGNYVLDLLVSADNVVPQVVGRAFNVSGVGEVELSDGHVENVPHAPTHLSLRFSETVNVQQLSNSAFQQTGQNTVSAVFIGSADGTRYFPRLQSYDPATETARFLMLDGLPNGEYTLHVSGGLGLTDLAGNPIVGNDASGDFVTRFTVADASRVGITSLRTNASGNDSFATAQDLGVLFPHELQSGVTLVRDAATNADQFADSADFFRFELLQTQAYFLSLSNFGDGAPPAIEVLNEAGQVTSLNSLPGGQGALGFLPAGRYVLHLGPWATSTASSVTYQVEIELGGAGENPTPLTSGAAPAVGIRLAGYGPAVVYAPPVVNEVSSSQFAAIPSGLLVGLNAPALGSQLLTTPSFSPDTALVRLFGFSSRDQLFSLIDATLPRSPEAPEITQAELTDDELLDLLNRKLDVSDDSTDESREAEDSSDIESSSDTTQASDKGGTDKEVGNLFPATPTTNQRKVKEPSNGRKKTPEPVTRNRVVRPAAVEMQSATEQPPTAFSAPLAFALATSLASTLREQSRWRAGRRQPPGVFDSEPGG